MLPTSGRTRRAWPARAMGDGACLSRGPFFHRIPRRRPQNGVLGSRRSEFSDLSHLLTPEGNAWN